MSTSGTFHWTAPSGAGFGLRPLTQADEARFIAFVDHLDPEDRRLRFFQPLRHLSPPLADKLTHVDQKKHLAFVLAPDDPASREDFAGGVRLVMGAAL